MRALADRLVRMHGAMGRLHAHIEPTVLVARARHTMVELSRPTPPHHPNPRCSARAQHHPGSDVTAATLVWAAFHARRLMAQQLELAAAITAPTSRALATALGTGGAALRPWPFVVPLAPVFVPHTLQHSDPVYFDTKVHVFGAMVLALVGPGGIVADADAPGYRLRAPTVPAAALALASAAAGFVLRIDVLVFGVLLAMSIGCIQAVAGWVWPRRLRRSYPRIEVPDAQAHHDRLNQQLTKDFARFVAGELGDVGPQPINQTSMHLDEQGAHRGEALEHPHSPVDGAHPHPSSGALAAHPFCRIYGNEHRRIKLFGRIVYTINQTPVTMWLTPGDVPGSFAVRRAPSTSSIETMLWLRTSVVPQQWFTEERSVANANTHLIGPPQLFVHITHQPQRKSARFAVFFDPAGIFMP